MFKCKSWIFPLEYSSTDSKYCLSAANSIRPDTTDFFCRQLNPQMQSNEYSPGILNTAVSTDNIPKPGRSCSWSNKSKTSASVWPGYPDTEKQMKARGRRPIAFIVSRCLETPVKHDARVFDMASKTIHTSFSN